MSNIYQFHRLQTIDSAIQESKRRLAHILQSQKEPQALVEAREKKQALVDERQQLQVQTRQQELAMGSLNAKLKATTDQLYSGREKNPKVLQDLQQEQTYLTRQRGELEETLLDAMVSLEETESALAEVEERLGRRERDWAAELSELKTAQQDTALHLNELLQQRQAHVARLDAQALKHYDQLLKTKRGLAVALVEDGICLGCRVSLDSNLLRAVHHGEMVTCSTCGRMLYSHE